MSYQFDSYVNRQEAEALKDMIFKRVRERSKAMTSDVQVDVMNVARESFVSKNNPFSEILAQAADSNAQKIEPPKAKEVTPISDFADAMEEGAENVGFPQKNLFAGISNQNRLIKDQMTASQIQNNMIEAREGLSNRRSFMGALAFLNSQAAVSLMNKRAGTGVDMVV